MFSLRLLRSGVLLLVLALLLVALMIPERVWGAELSFSPASGSHGVNSQFSVQIQVNPQGQSVNSAEGVVRFDTNTLSVVSLSQSGSAFSLWTAEPSFSNSAGTITFSGGTPTAFSNQRGILTITFRGTSQGQADVSFSEGTILAADGMGTDVYSGGGTARYTITAAAAPPPPPATQAPNRPLVAGDPPAAPLLRSTSHEDSEAWYATSTVQLSWIVTPDVTNIRVLLSQDEAGAPTEEHDPTTESWTFTDVADGTWYAYVQFQNSFGWGEAAQKKILIDTEPPGEFDLLLLQDGEHAEEPKFSFQAEDTLSGVERYEILFGERVVATVRSQDLKDGMHPVPPQEGGLQLVTIRAYDGAGNMRAAEREFELPVVVRRAAGAPTEVEDPPLITFERILLFLFVFSTGALTAWNYFMKKTAMEERASILQEISGMRDKNDRVFTAMREEFEQLINDLDDKPQLSPAERNLLESIKEVLELSEELIDSESEDLKKLIRKQ